ncbi:MAG: hypothetical protein IPM51_11735 [Sphingobacteriaceae bacterium]|nr:hypothetical protein [Sphingobacteriaceae bacterium]
MPTIQETYDSLVKHLRTQKKRSITSFKGAVIGAYRGHNDLKSPVGFLLGPFYLPEFEGQGLKDSLIHWIIERQLKHNFNLCCAFERMHDTIPPEYWENEFQCISKIYKTIYTPVSYRVIKADEDELVGYLVNGKFICLEKANHIPQFPRPVAIYKSHIGNFSQICSLNKQLIIDGLKSQLTNKPICMFPY